MHIYSPNPKYKKNPVYLCRKITELSAQLVLNKYKKSVEGIKEDFQVLPVQCSAAFELSSGVRSAKTLNLKE